MPWDLEVPTGLTSRFFLHLPGQWKTFVPLLVQATEILRRVFEL
jgi:hypothetical protein